MGFNRLNEDIFQNEIIKKRLTVLTWDLMNKISVGLLKELEDVNIIVHMCAETHVDNSINNPSFVIKNNIMSTVNILEFARQLKDLIKNPVKNNGSLGCRVSKENDKQSDFKEVWEYYKKNFTQHGFDSLYGALYYLKKKGVGLQDPKKLLEMFHQAKNIPFLKVANKFGWQEAVLECYGRAGNQISDSSNHVSKYKNHRPGFAWFVMQAQRILRGEYQPKDPSYKQRHWATLFKDKKMDVVKTRTTSKPSSKALEGEIQENTAFDAQEKDLRLSLLKRAGASLYKTWFSNCMTVREEGGTVHLKAPSMFVRDMIQQKVLIPLGLTGKMVVFS